MALATESIHETYAPAFVFAHETSDKCFQMEDGLLALLKAVLKEGSLLHCRVLELIVQLVEQLQAQAPQYDLWRYTVHQELVQLAPHRIEALRTLLPQNV